MSPLTWADLLIQDITPENSALWLSEWTGHIGGHVSPIFLNKFGSWFFRRPEGHVEMLDVYTGVLQKIADSYEEFQREVNEQWWQEVYLLSELVRELHQHDKVPGPGQCYALAPHPALGGRNPANGERIDPRFVLLMDVAVWQSVCVQSLYGPRPPE